MLNGKTHSTICCAEALHFRNENIYSQRHTSLDGCSTQFPKFVMIISEQYDASTRAGIERRWCITDRVFDYGNNTVVRNRRLFAQGVEGAAGFGRFKEGCSVSHVVQW